eukprot:COSAG05_NODE_23288_length_259_cov_0.631250_1_plen_25_part_10
MNAVRKTVRYFLPVYNDDTAVNVVQ